MTTPTRAIAAFAALTKNVNRVAAQASARLAKLTKEIKAAKPKARKPKAKAKAKTTRKAAPKAARKAAPKYAWTAIDNRQTQQPAAPRATTPRIKRTAVAEPAQIAEAKPKMAPISRGVRVGGRRASGDRASGDRAGGESASGESAGGEDAPPRSVKLAGLAERLEDSELVMLSAAMNRPDRCLLPIASRFHDRHHELVASLRRLGLVAEVPAQRHSPKWEHGGDEGGWGTTLVLTGKAFDALGIERPPDLRRGQMKEKPP